MKLIIYHEKLIIFILAVAIGCIASAQQNGKIKHMTVTIVDDHAAFRVGHRPSNMFITRDDTAQVQKVIDLNTHVKAGRSPQLMSVCR